VNSVREDTVRKGLLFAGTETAVWVSFDDGDHWQSLQLNLPHTSMRDLWIHGRDLIVATHGRSFWILDDITPLEQITDSLAATPAHLFDPELAYRVRRSTYTDTPLPPDEPTGKNPPDGAILDYYLAKDASGPVTLEILDSQGKLVRRYSSTDQPEQSMEELEKQLIPLYWIRMPRILSAAAGMHRWVWDLRYPAPLSDRHEYPISAVPHDTPRVPQGPLALPGTYMIKLTADGQSFKAPLEVKMDPRVGTPSTGLALEFEFGMRLSKMMSASTQAIREAHSMQEQLEKLTPQAKGTAADAVKEFSKKLDALMKGSPNAGTKPAWSRVSGTVAGLYGAVGQADATPTAAQTAAIAQVEEDFSAVSKDWGNLKSSDLPALNRQLQGAGLSQIKIEATPPQQEEMGSDEP